MSKGTAIVVGAGPGLGMALARAFAAEDHPVALLSRDRQRGQRYATELADAGRAAKFYRADAGEPQELMASLNRAIDELGAPDVLIYNAAVLQGDKPTELDGKEWAHRLAVNVTGAIIATNTVLARLRGGRGTLLFTGGGLALDPSPAYTAMSVGKAGLRAYVLALFAHQRVNGVHAATVTIAGAIGQPGFEADSIAERYLELHHQPPAEWTAEIVID